MRTLVLAIETVGEAWETIDPTTQAILERPVERRAEDPYGWVTQSATMQRELSLSPLTGSIISLALYDVERTEGVVYYVGDANISRTAPHNVRYKSRTEAALLQEFWEGARSYDTFVTFNGRAFTLPFMLHRSVARGIAPTRELMKYRYLAQQVAPFHIDLLDELTFYGAMRPQALHLFCRAWGIENHAATAFSGADVASAYEAGHHVDIISHNSNQVRLIAELYTRWYKNLAPQSFLDTVDL